MVTTRARCGCGAEVLEGVTLSGFDVRLDEVELTTPLAELDTLTRGGRTFSHHLVPDVVASRPAYKITDAPAGTRPRVAVRPEHRCTSRGSRP